MKHHTLQACVTPSVRPTIGSYARTLLAFLISKNRAQETVMTRKRVNPGSLLSKVENISELPVRIEEAGPYHRPSQYPRDMGIAIFRGLTWSHVAQQARAKSQK